MALIRALTAADLAEAKAIWELRFDDSPAFVGWFFAERFSPETSFCAVEDGRIVSIAHGSVMQLRMRGVSLPALMVSGVATLPGFEHRGLMKQVLFAMFSACKARGIPLAFHKPSHFSIYRAVGEFPCWNALFHTCVAAPAQPVCWDAVPPAETLLRVYRQSTSRYDGCVIRSLGDMERRVHDLSCDGARCLVHRTGGLPDGYLFASLDEDGSLCAEETLASSPEAYQALVSRLPEGSLVKLPPDTPLSGVLRPWGVLIPVDVSFLIRSIGFGADAFSLEVFDETLPWNNGVFNGTGATSDTAPTDSLSVGRLMQFLCGYLPFRNLLPQANCYCADEY